MLRKASNLILEKLKFTEVLVEMVFVLMPVQVSRERRSQWELHSVPFIPATYGLWSP